MNYVFKLLVLLLNLKVVIATNFSADDEFNPDPTLACNGKILKNTDLYIAHKKLPCGTKILLYNPRNGRTVVAVRQDWGPIRSDIDLGPARYKGT